MNINASPINTLPTTETGLYEFSTFTGADIKAVFHGHVIGTLQQIGYRLQREIAPVYTLGSMDPRGYGHGKRMAVGTLVFTAIDRNALLEAMRQVAIDNPGFRPWLDREDALPECYAGIGKVAQPVVSASDVGILTTGGITRQSQAGGAETMSGVFTGEDELSGSLVSDQVHVLPSSVTEIMPFTITIVSSNEYGKSSEFSLYGVKITSEAFNISIDHVTSDMSFEFIALGVSPQKPVLR